MNSKNKQVDRTIEEIFLKYSIYQIRLKHWNQIENNCIDSSKERMENFIKQIDEILIILNSDEKEFLTNVYINKMSKLDFHVSVSNFYYRKRKYNDILYKCLYLI